MIQEVIAEAEEYSPGQTQKEGQERVARLTKNEGRQQLARIRQLRTEGKITDMEYRAQKFILKQQMGLGVERTEHETPLSEQAEVQRELKASAGLSSGASALQTLALNEDLMENFGMSDELEDDLEVDYEMDDIDVGDGSESALDEALGQLKLLVSHLQIFGGFAGAITLSWPSIMYDAKSLASTIDFDFNSLLAIPCHVRSFTYYEEMTFAAALPVA